VALSSAIFNVPNYVVGVINCLAVGKEEVNEVGLALCHNPLIRKLSFTGSTNVGKWLMRESADTVKKVSYSMPSRRAALT
jgi:succinate-semialdehyde dehydrogenase / glutarate-semialdehyde dehydrogenase